MKNTMVYIFIFLMTGLMACDTDPGKTTNKNPEGTAKTVSNVDSLPELAKRVDTAAISQQLGGSKVKITPMENPSATAPKTNMSEAEKRALWNEKISEQINVAMKTMVTEYNKGTFKDKMVTTPSGLQYMVLQKGDGTKVPEGKVAYVHNFITLKDGTQVESNFKHDDPLRIRLNGKSTIPGMEEAIKLMDMNSNYLFMIPSKLAYGAAGNPPGVPSNSDLMVYMALTGYE
ncbi:MAG: FKBP-type peptidyl-prolyl cis-trans isomerase [Saprospiraceae bacterium]|nr:FKBP-type peptidyl-prolyl cis-trans isomerase [Saprospiraceae bacterium]